MLIGKPSEFQQEQRILVSCIAAYQGKVVPAGVHYMLHSAMKHNIQVRMFAADKKFDNMWTTKFLHLRDCLEAHRKEYDWVINVDAADVLFLADLDSFFYNKIDDKVLFCAERNCFPDPNLVYPPCPTSYRYLNGGGFFGKMDVVLETMFLPVSDHRNDDQLAWSKLYLSSGKIVLDKQCQVFQTLWGHTTSDFGIGDWITNLETGTMPCILHANGSNTENEVYQSCL